MRPKPISGRTTSVASQWSIGGAGAVAINRVLYDEVAAGAHPAVALKEAITSLRDQLAGDDQDAAVTEFAWWAPLVHHGAPR